MVAETLTATQHRLNRRENIEGYLELEREALDLFNTWHHSADKIWKQLDPALWEATRNPWLVLQTVSTEKLEKTLQNPEFKQLLYQSSEKYNQYLASPTWFKTTHPKSPLTCLAYFSMEFMLSESLPIYSGGLGNVAGDQLKAASDLGVPVIGVSLLYQQGYFRQVIDKDGRQEALYPYNEPRQLPVMPLRKADGEWLRIEIPLPGYSLWLRAWEVNVGRVRLYLLDSNDPANTPANRGITSELYGGGLDLRIRQELILGLAGFRLLNELGIHPEVCHLNEGHAAFAILERTRRYMMDTGHDFETALTATRAGNVFTTHTAVPAGFDRFPPWMIEQYLKRYCDSQLHISVDELLKLGRENPSDTKEWFNMAFLALNGSCAVNGVSRLHGKVSRSIFQPFFSRWPQEEVPIGYITNGVHVPSWDSALSDKVWTDACGPDRWLGPTEALATEIRDIPSEVLWNMRNESRKSLVEYARRRYSLQLASVGASLPNIEKAKTILDPNILTLGFARRFATYKRPNMLLHDQERLLRILNSSERPVQLIIAGKAHPADKPGQALITEWINFTKWANSDSKVVFLSDYDISMAEHLVQGVDVWMNTPRRPWEASGTSGMKVLVNGGINLSELDGWWAEAYTPEVGWAIGDGWEHGDDPSWDGKEACQLYDILEKEVIPEFYARDAKGIPERWVTRMRESMARLTPRYSSNRTVRDYTEQSYLIGVNEYLTRVAEKGKVAQEIVEWKKNVNRYWPELYFVKVNVTSDEERHLFDVEVYLGELDQKAIKVELHADCAGRFSSEQIEMRLIRNFPNSKVYQYQKEVSAERPASDFAARIIPYFPGVIVPLELNHILWQR